MQPKELAQKRNISEKSVIDWMSKHDIRTFRGQIDLPPSILAAITELPDERVESRVKRAPDNFGWLEGHKIEIISDVRQFNPDDKVLYKDVKEIFSVQRKFDDGYAIYSEITKKVISSVQPEDLTLIRIIA
jgi:hypothetical protein